MIKTTQRGTRLWWFLALVAAVAILSTIGFKNYFDSYSWGAASMMGAVSSLLAAFPAALVFMDVRSAMTVTNPNRYDVI